MIDFREELERLSESGNLRTLPCVEHCEGDVVVNGKRLKNLSSNDYLSIATDNSLRERFFRETPSELLLMGSTSSRLLSGNYSSHQALERTLGEMFGRSALSFSTGYQMNSGLLGAVSDSRTLILADKLVHASIIDGLKLCNGRFIRFAHQNYGQLENLIEKYSSEYPRIIIVVESVYSMDGDIADLNKLVEIKKRHSGIELYVDEAHAIGVRGTRGLGVAEEVGVIGEIDYLCGTFGKAVGSVGAYVICSEIVKEYLVNKMRTLIFTTALPPINMEWTRWVLEHFDEFAPRRAALENVSTNLRNSLKAKGYNEISGSHIIPVIIGESAEAVARAQELQSAGFYAMAVREPTVPKGTARLRLSLNSSLTHEDIQKLSNEL